MSEMENLPNYDSYAAVGLSELIAASPPNFPGNTFSVGIATRL
jgi:hypothetical protein